MEIEQLITGMWFKLNSVRNLKCSMLVEIGNEKLKSERNGDVYVFEYFECLDLGKLSC